MQHGTQNIRAFHTSILHKMNCAHTHTLAHEPSCHYATLMPEHDHEFFLFFFQRLV